MKRIAFYSAMMSIVLACGCDAPVESGRGSGKKAPDFAGRDVDGNAIRLSDYRGKVVLLDFWGTWCGPCKEMIPHEIDMVMELKGKPFEILGVAMDDPDKLRLFLDQKPLPWKNILDTSRTISKEWNVEAVPTFILIDHKGIVLERWVGMPPNMQAIKKAIKKVE
jgi:peroxiredoxin